MESINDVATFDLLNEVNKIDVLCDKHNIKLVQFRDKTPFCQKCALEERDRKEQALIQKSVEANYIRKTTQVLSKDSMCEDRTILNATFENYVANNQETMIAKEKAIKIANKYTDVSNNFNTILTGVAGTGKSHLAMSILKKVNEECEVRTSCLFISTNELMRKIKSSFNDKHSRYTEERLVTMCKEVDLLVLDDLGSESTFRKEKQSESTEYTQNVLFGILEARTRTIITTNLTSKELNYVYNKKIVSRLYRGLSDSSIIKFTEATKDKRVGFEF